MKMGDGDRGISWLPFYHDMGLVGCMLTCVANQMSVDYLKTEHFARRPLAWLDLISRNEGTTLSYSPTFGYDICARRISSQSNVAERFDLSRWRLAGNGADMIRPDVMQSFVNAFADAGFKASAFTPSYGLAEATLAVTVMPPGEGIRVELGRGGTPLGHRATSAPRATGRSSTAASRRPTWMSRSAARTAGRSKDHQIGKVCAARPGVMHSISATRK
jgi:fatty-acyl-CoA synthase